MSKILNKRNAVLGWLAWIVGKRAAKRKIHQPSRGRLLAMGGIAASVVALGVAGAAIFARRERDVAKDLQPV